MSTTIATPPAPVGPPHVPALTLDGFLRRYAGAYVEVLDGVVKEIPTPQPLHGQVCFKAALYLGGHITSNALGVVCTNDTFVLIRADPLQVHGANVVYWSKVKAPVGVPREGMITAPPDLCVEVVSPTNTWSEVFTKVGEYLGIGVSVVIVLDPNTTTASAYRGQPGQNQQILDSLRNSDRWPIHRVMTNYEKLRRKPLLFRMF
ncbi:MAG: Uma2 family endonuclease, partial [Planctomycetes bacterium]|nr:Uma2 family endonuclease [Planctomycetota bacterium]